jgi:hypothetical protein
MGSQVDQAANIDFGFGEKESSDWDFILTQSKIEILVLVKGNCQKGFQVN